MPTIRFQVTTDQAPQAVLEALIDFSDRRPDVWPNIDRSHFRVHGQGTGWAEVTEGNIIAWERNRYEWDAASGAVSVTTMESDAWATGSQWQYRLHPTATGGTQVEVTVVRTGRGLRGRLVGAAITWFGARTLRSDMEKVLRRIGDRARSA